MMNLPTEDGQLDDLTARMILQRWAGYSFNDIPGHADLCRRARRRLGLVHVADYKPVDTDYDHDAYRDTDRAEVRAAVTNATDGITRCPFCDATDVHYGSDPVIAGPQAEQVARCTREECSAEWVETYTFTGIYVRDAGNVRTIGAGKVSISAAFQALRIGAQIVRRDLARDLRERAARKLGTGERGHTEATTLLDLADELDGGDHA